MDPRCEPWNFWSRLIVDALLNRRPTCVVRRRAGPAAVVPLPPAGTFDETGAGGTGFVVLMNASSPPPLLGDGFACNSAPLDCLSTDDDVSIRADADDDDDDDDDDASLAAICRTLSFDMASHSTEVKHSGHVTAPPSHSASRQLVHTTCEQDSIRGCTSGGSLQNAS